MSSRPELRLDWCSQQAAEWAIMRWHYSKRMPKGKLARIGVWENGAFIGAVLYGNGANKDLLNQYGLTSTQGAELVRVALKRHAVEVSRVVSISMRMLRKAFPSLRLLVSFADPEQGHAGGIYQAGNWIYSGRTNAADEYIYKGKRWHGRAFRCSHKGMEHHPEVTIVKGTSKHRYLMPLDDEMRRRVACLAKPYPKRAGSADSGTPGIQPGRDGANPIPALMSSTDNAKAAVQT
jgi:hypothetical protein